MEYAAPYGKERLSGRGYFTPTGTIQGVDLGNIEMFKVDFGIKRKEHFSARRGIMSMDRYDAYQSQALWTLTCDEFVSPTLAYAWAGTVNTNFSQTAQVATTFVLSAGAATGSKKGATFDIGKYGLYDVAIAGKVEGYTADYVVDRAGGKLYIPLSSTIADAATVTVTFSCPLLTYDSVTALQILNRVGVLEVQGEDDSGQGKSTTGSPGVDALPPVRYLFTVPCILSSDSSGEYKVDDYRKITILASATAAMTVKRLQ